MINFPSEHRVNAVVQSHGQITKVVTLAPMVKTLLTLAADQKACSNRWHSYEMLKRACSQYVGWDATSPELKSGEIYRQTMQAIDALLPVASTLTGGADLRALRESVLELCPTLALPEWSDSDEKAG